MTDSPSFAALSHFFDADPRALHHLRSIDGY